MRYEDDSQFLIRDAKTHERLYVTDDPSVRPGESRDAVYIDAYCDEDRARLDEWWVENNRTAAQADENDLPDEQSHPDERGWTDFDDTDDDAAGDG
jgi:hypothetical protein